MVFDGFLKFRDFPAEIGGRSLVAGNPGRTKIISMLTDFQCN
jgi:hypothetical protein